MKIVRTAIISLLTGIILVGCYQPIHVDPLDLTVDEASIGVHSATLYWGISSEGLPDSYVLSRAQSDNLVRKFRIEATETSFTDESLDGGSIYTYSIIPEFTGCYSTVYSNDVVVQTLPDEHQTLDVPTSFTARLLEDDPRRVAISWAKVYDAASYEIVVYKYGFFEERRIVGDESDLRLDSLSYNNVWQFSIRAHNFTEKFYSKMSNSIQIDMPYHAYPAASSAAPLLMDRVEKFYLKPGTDGKQIWAYFETEGKAFTIDVDNSAVVWRLYSSNGDGTLDFQSSGKGGIGPVEVPADIFNIGGRYYLNLNRSSYSEQYNDFSIHIISED